MKILSAAYANADNSGVILQTVEAGAVALDLSQPTNDKRGRLALDEWLAAGNVIQAFTLKVSQAEINAGIKSQIAALDLKRIRPLAEGDTVYLAKLNEQIAALRAQLK